jgi:predicted Zn-dependent protease
MLVSEAQELNMGRKAALSLNWDFGGEYRDRELQEYFGTIVRRIWGVSERPHLPLTFRVQNTSLPNAFAIPGYVAITRGLLVELENEAQFASIMGHETGHVMARHSASRMSMGLLQQVGLGIGGALLADTRGADTLMTLGAVGSSLLLLKYDRSQELQADRLGVVYSARLGYDPFEAVAAHERLERAVTKYLNRHGKSSQSGGFMSEILSTHPRKEVRVEEIKGMIETLPPYRPVGDGKFASDFTRMISGLKNAHKAYIVYDDAERAFENRQYRDAERLVRNALRMNSRQAPFRTLQGKIALVENKYDVAVEYFKTALSYDSSYQPALFALGVAEYKRNRLKTSLGHVQKSLSLYPEHRGSLYVAGLCYHELNRPQNALAHFGALAELVKDHPEVYGYMGLNYEKINKIDLAIEAYSAQIKIAPDNLMGRHARQRLAVLKGTGKR